MAVKRYLLDSNALTSFINHREPLAQHVRNAKQRACRIGTCEPVVAEMFYGLELSASREKNLVRLQRGLNLISCWPLDRAASEMYGRVAAELKRQGRPMQVVDIMIAAIALSLGHCTVVSTDSVLLDIPGLSVENWELEEAAL
jgi:tRNA(fMet)-specific endonuclease VapC